MGTTKQRSGQYVDIGKGMCAYGAVNDESEEIEMSVIVPEGFSNLTLVMTVAGSLKEMTNSIGILCTDLTPPSLQDQTDNLYDIAVASGHPWQAAAFADEWTFQGVVLTTTVDGLPVVTQHLEPLSGTNSGATQPPNCAAIIRKVTGSGGRKNRGRLFMPAGFLVETQVDAAGFLDEGVVDGFNTQFASWHAALLSADFLPELFHSDATDPTGITAFSAESLIGTQRRRLR